MGIIDDIKTKRDFVFLKKVEDKDINDLQKDLGLEINDEYKKCIKEFGAFTFEGHEFFGICDSERLSIKNETIEIRNMKNDFPQDLYIIESLYIDDIYMAQDKDGKIYQVGPGDNIVKMCDSFGEYVMEE